MILDSLQNLRRCSIATIESKKRNDTAQTKEGICKVLSASPHPVQQKKNHGTSIVYD